MSSVTASYNQESSAGAKQNTNDGTKGFCDLLGRLLAHPVAGTFTGVFAVVLLAAGVSRADIAHSGMDMLTNGYLAAMAGLMLNETAQFFAGGRSLAGRNWKHAVGSYGVTSIAGTVGALTPFML